MLSICLHAQTNQQRSDSILAERLLLQGNKLQSSGASKEKIILFYARSFRGTPYVAHTLDRSKTEQLVVNLHELDCTTYIENVYALTLCTLRGETSFGAFRNQLRLLRYRNGQLSYANRLHYYQWWITDNARMGFFSEITQPATLFRVKQQLNLNYMTTHASAYTMLRGNKQRQAAIRRFEQSGNDRVSYLPKRLLRNTRALRQTIHDGDLIAIVTTKRGLDTSHLGIAVWHADGLHLLNASSLQKNGKSVVEPTETLATYLRSRTSNPGIRVARLKGSPQGGKM